MKFKAKIRQHVGIDSPTPAPFWKLWETPEGEKKRKKIEIVHSLRDLLTQGDTSIELKVSQWFGKSYELAGFHHTPDLSIECVFRLEFDANTSQVEFDIDIYGEYYPVGVSGLTELESNLEKASGVFQETVRRLANRLANRFGVAFQVQKLSAVAPLVPAQLRFQEFRGRSFKPVTPTSWSDRETRFRQPVDSGSGMSDTELWLWYLYLSQDRPDIQVYNPETRAVEPNPFASGGGGDFASGGATGSWEAASVGVMSDARGEDTPTPAPLPPIYTAEPRDETPHNEKSSVIPPTEDWKPIAESTSDWNPRWTSGREPEICTRDDHSSPSPAPAPTPESSWTSSPPADSYSSSDSGGGGGDD